MDAFLLDSVHDSLASNSGPLLVAIRVMKRCTVRCQMCDFWKTSDDGYSWLQMKNILEQCAMLGVQHICLTGGEPTLYRHFFATVQYIMELGMSYSFITNGSLLTKGVISRIMDCPPSRVHVSIDSSVPEKHDEARGHVGLWEQALKGIVGFNEYSPRPLIVVNYVVSNRNFWEIPEIVKLYGGLIDEVNLLTIKGMPSWQLSVEQIMEYNSRVVPALLSALMECGIRLRGGSPYIFGRSIEEVENSSKAEYAKTFYKKFGCSVSHSMLFIDELGNVFPCNNTQYNPSIFNCGNILEDSLKVIWHSEKIKAVQRMVANSAICAGCDPVNQFINQKVAEINTVAWRKVYEVSH